MVKGKGKWRVAIGIGCWELIRTNRGAIEVYPRNFPSMALAKEFKAVLNGKKPK